MRHLSVVACLIALACAAEEPDADASDTEPLAVDGVDCSAPVSEVRGDSGCGEAAFALRCARCHGDDGLGDAEGPDLSAHVPFHNDVEVLWVMAAGQGLMPANLAPAPEPAHLLAWMRETFGEYDGVGHTDH